MLSSLEVLLPSLSSHAPGRCVFLRRGKQRDPNPTLLPVFKWRQFGAFCAFPLLSPPHLVALIAAANGRWRWFLQEVNENWMGTFKLFLFLNTLIGHFFAQDCFISYSLEEDGGKQLSVFLYNGQNERLFVSKLRDEFIF